MMSQAFTDWLAELGSLPCIRKSCGRQPSAEPTTSARSIVGYTSHLSLTLSEVHPNILLLSGV